jgi:hypothetical protein
MRRKWEMRNGKCEMGGASALVPRSARRPYGALVPPANLPPARSAALGRAAAPFPVSDFRFPLFPISHFSQ